MIAGSDTSARQTLPADVRQRTVVDTVRYHADLSPNRLALVAQSAVSGETRLTYRQLAFQAEVVAGNLAALGVRPGDHVGVLLSNASGHEIVLTMLGSMRLGAAAVMLSTRSAAEEQERALGLTDCRMLVFGEDSATLIRSLRSRLPKLDRFVGVGVDPVLEEATSWEEMLDPRRRLGASEPCPVEDDVADLFLTSGTTGHSRAVVLTHANAVASGIATARGLGIKGEDIVQTPIPLTASGGGHVCLMGALCAGATMVVDPPFDAETTFDRIARERTSVLIAAPAMYVFMLEAHDPNRHDATSLRMFDFGSAPMAAEMIRRLHDAFPHVELRQNYGMTESGPVGTYLDGDSMREKLGSIGRPVLCEIRIVNEEGRDVPTGEVGEFWIRGPGVMLGYYNNEEATTDALAGGWLRTGDIGRVDEDGFYYHLDRKKDIIIRGGSNISSMEVENTLLRHPAVNEAAVVAVPHPKLGEDVFAFVVPREGERAPDADEIAEFCTGKIGRYKIPRRLAVIDALPRNPAGKVLKKVLREEAARLVERNRREDVGRTA
jgi:acyl-CoA synthetase (AMP-forming)/AMP-acid ligase II